MKNVYFAQPSNKLPGSVYLPYSVGAIAAYSWQFEEIRSAYHLGDFIFIQEDISQTVENLENPFLVGFSCYMWNTEYNLSLAQEIKKKWPECITVFGGPDIPESHDYLEKYEFIDVLMIGEGEVTFKNLLTAIDTDKSLETVNNIIYRSPDGYVATLRVPPGDITDFPSPYTTGLFDGIINNPKYKDLQFDITFETNRGCPHNCSFCYWGRCNSKFRTFPTEKVRAEIDWFVKHKTSFWVCADANFGILKRDEEIAEYIIEQKKLHGYPVKFESIAAKNKNERVFRINSKLAKAGLTNGVSIACQSLSDEVLKNIGRENVALDELAAQFRKYSQAGIPTYTDLILALPGDTYDGFCHSLFSVIEAGQHNIINVLPLELLPNTLMNTPETLKKYAIKTIKSKLCLSRANCHDVDSYGSRSEVVVETSTMSRSDWRKAFRLSVMVQGFHCLNLLTYIAVYLRRERNISYQDFYTSLYEWSESKNNYIKSITDKVCRSADLFLEEKGNLGFSDKMLGDTFWQFQEGMFIFAVSDVNLFFEEIKEFSKQFNPDERIFNDVLHFQKEMIVMLDNQERTVDFLYNWKEYFEDICDTASKNLQPHKTALHFKEKKFENIYDYAFETIWRGKKQKKMLNLDAEIC